MAPNQLLKEWISATGITYAEAARRVFHDTGNFHRIVIGAAKPTMELAHKIAEVTNGSVPLEAWIGFVPDKTARAKTAQAEAA